MRLELAGGPIIPLFLGHADSELCNRHQQKNLSIRGWTPFTIGASVVNCGGVSAKSRSNEPSTNQFVQVTKLQHISSN